jgi:ammonium transporter, Amt family
MEPFDPYRAFVTVRGQRAFGFYGARVRAKTSTKCVRCSKVNLLPLFALGALLVEVGMGRAKGALHCSVKGLTAFAVGVLLGALGRDWTDAMLCGTVALLATVGLGDRVTLAATVFLAAGISIVHKLVVVFDRFVAASLATFLPEPFSALNAMKNLLANFWQPDYAFVWSIHTLAGGAALGALLVSGPRVGRYNRNGTPTAIPAHSLPLAGIGVFLLWIGLQSFSQPIWDAATLSAFVALLCSLVWTKWRFGKVDPSFTVTGFWTGLVAGLALGKVSFALSVLTGILSGIAAVSVSLTLDRHFIDDPVGIVSAEGIATLIGLAVQWVGKVSFLGAGFASWAMSFLVGFSAAWVTGRILSAFNLLRLAPIDEFSGADLRLYGITAYPEFEMREA